MGNKIAMLRNAEVQSLRKLIFMRIANTTILYVVPSIVAILIFVTMVFLGTGT
jgi:hypothetical protein